MTTNDDMRPPSGSHIGGWRAAFCPRYLRIMTTMAALWLPLRGLEGGLLSRTSADYDDHGRPLAPILGLEGGLFPGYATIMATIMLPSSSISGLEGGFLSRYLRIMTTMAALWLHNGAGGRPFVPEYAPIMPTTMARNILRHNFIFQRTIFGPDTFI